MPHPNFGHDACFPLITRHISYQSHAPPPQTKPNPTRRFQHLKKPGRHQFRTRTPYINHLPPIPCARFAHSATVRGDELWLFGGRDHRGPLNDLYLLELGTMGNPSKWIRPDVSGLRPPPSSDHVAAIVGDSLVIVSGEKKWDGHIWILQIVHPYTWFRTTTEGFPLPGLTRMTLVPLESASPSRHKELMLFGGALNRSAHCVFMSLDVTGEWKYATGEAPTEYWEDREAFCKQLEMGPVDLLREREFWHAEIDTYRARQRQGRLGKLATMVSNFRKGGGKGEDADEDAERADGAKKDRGEGEEHEQDDFLPPYEIRTISLREWDPVRMNPAAMPLARFGHAMAICEGQLYVFGGRSNQKSLGDLHAFDAKPLSWRGLPFDGEASLR